MSAAHLADRDFDRDIVEIERLRRLRRTGAEIAEIVPVSPATVSRTLQMLGLNKWT